jgi:pimeloyl-ACP methyl ester carboxylesterase
MTTMLRHNRVDLALHELRPATADGAHPLLLLHGLGERSPAAVPPHADGWTGAVHALDLTGHGASTVPAGGGYTAEILMGDVDAALAHLGPATVLGRGLGAYVALLIAGARPDLVLGAVLTDGPGLFGGAIGPSSPQVVVAPDDAPGPPDPYALLELSRDVRPPDYAVSFARSAAAGSGIDPPLAVAAMGRPEWLAAVIDSLVLEPTRIDTALELYGARP